MGHPLSGEDASVIVSVVTLQSQPHRTHNHTLLPDLRFRYLHLYPPLTGWPTYTARNRARSLSPLTTRRDMTTRQQQFKHSSMVTDTDATVESMIFLLG
jgi:hypothetical protein